MDPDTRISPTLSILINEELSISADKELPS